MENTEVTFNQVKEALEIASRVEKVRDYIRGLKADMTYEDDAVLRVRTDDVELYTALSRLSDILYVISYNANRNWNQTDVKEGVVAMKNKIL